MRTKSELRRAQRKKGYVDNLENEKVTMKTCYAMNADKHKAVKREYSKPSMYSILREKENCQKHFITPTLNQRRHPLVRAIGMTLSWRKQLL